MGVVIYSDPVIGI